MVSWLGLEALRICLEHGPAPALVGPAAFTAFGAIALRGDYAAAYRAARRILALAEARGYEPGTSQARMLFAVLSGWAEPIENSVHASRRAREGLIAGGDLANASYTYYASVSGLLDCAPLDRYLPRSKRRWPLRAVPATSSRAGARQLPVAGRCAARQKHGRGRRGGLRRQVRRQPAGAFTLISVMRTLPPSSAIRPAWSGTPRRRCHWFRCSRASTRPPSPACCAGWPWPGRPATRMRTTRGGLLSELDE